MPTPSIGRPFVAAAWLLCAALMGCGGSASDNGSTATAAASNAASNDTASAAAVAAGTTTSPAPLGTTALIDDQRPIPIPATNGYPAKGSTIKDPVTGFRVTRVADAAELTGNYGGHRSAISAIVYSRFTPVNTTGEYVLVHGDDSTSAWVYRVKDNQPVTILRFNPAQGEASRALGEVNELRWDYSGAHPYRLYFVGSSITGTAVAGENIGMSFYSTEIDPSTGQQAAPVLVHDFSHEFPGLAGAEIMNDVEGDSSNDSRYWGPVPESYLKGRAFMVYWSVASEEEYLGPTGYGDRARQLGRLALNFFTLTRWDRTFLIVR